MTGHRKKSAFITFLIFSCCLTGQAYSGNDATNNILVIGWDAADRSHVEKLLEIGKLPNLAALIQEGKMIGIDVVTGATDTKAGWTQLLTGYIPEKTGV